LGISSWLRHLFSSLVTSQFGLLNILIRNYFLIETLFKEKEGGTSQISAPPFGFLEETKLKTEERNLPIIRFKN
jgi:hypothetical protein